MSDDKNEILSQVQEIFKLAMGPDINVDMDTEKKLFNAIS